MSGFIPGSRGSFMLDLVASAMILVLPLLYLAIALAKRRQYLQHKVAMICIVAVLMIVVAAFEYEMRMIGWLHLAEQSPFYSDAVPYVLGVHLFFSVTTTLGLLWTVFSATKNFASPPAPNYFSGAHRRMGYAAAIGLALTSVTGWIFYWMAFMAT